MDSGSAAINPNTCTRISEGHKYYLSRYVIRQKEGEGGNRDAIIKLKNLPTVNDLGA